MSMEDDELLRAEEEKFASINENVEAYNDRIRQTVEVGPAEYFSKTGGKENPNAKHDRTRYANKTMLWNLASEYLNAVQKYEQTELDLDGKKKENLASLKTALQGIEQYAQMDVTALRGNDKARKDEAALFDRILNSLNTLSKDVDGQQLSRDADDKVFNDIDRMTNVMRGYFDGQRDGDLDFKETKTVKPTVDATGLMFKRGDIFDSDVSNEEQPLFPHDPSYDDIHQGVLGDCYLVSSLSSLAINHPEKIKQAMRDNKDGTVTVRFWQRRPGDKGPGINDTFEPVYVKVDKVTPNRGAAQGSVWVQTLERAYAASGLHIPRKDTVLTSDRYASPTPPIEKLKDDYRKYKAMDRYDRPCHEECPWLIDEDGNLHEYQPSYENVDGGKSGQFIESLLGPDFQNNVIDVSSKTNPAPGIIDSYIGILLDGIKSTAPGAAPFTAEERRRIKEDYDAKRILPEDIVYKAVVGNPNASFPRDAENKRDYSSPRAAIAKVLCYEFDRFCSARFNKGNNAPDNKARYDLRGFKDFMHKLGDDNTKKIYGEEHPGVARTRGILENDKNYKAFMDKWVDIFTKNCETFYHEQFGYKKYTGQYSIGEKNILAEIKRALGGNPPSPVTLGTKRGPAGEGDTVSDRGILYGHAYTVMDVVERKLPSKPGEPDRYLTMLKVRDPNASILRNYATKGGKLQAFEAEGDIGYIELSDLQDIVDKVYVNEKVQAVNHENMPKVTDPIDMSTVSRYYRSLESIREKLDTGFFFSKDSQQYKDLKKTLNETIKVLPDLKGKSMQDLSGALEKLNLANQEYKRHCETVKRSDYVRTARVEASAAIDVLLGCASQKVRDPKRFAIDQVARKISDAMLKEKKIRADRDERIEFARRLRNNDKFKDSYGKGTYFQISRAMTLGGDTLLKGLSSYMKTEVTEAKKEEIHNAIERANQKKPKKDGMVL